MALQGLSYELVEFPLPDSYDLCSSIFGLFWCDLGKNILKEFEGEPLSKSGTGVVSHAETPVWMLRILSWLFSVKGLPMYSPRMREILQMGLHCQKLNEFTDCVHHLKEMRNALIQKMEDEQIDLIIGPVMPFPSLEERVANLFASNFYKLNYLLK